MNEKDLSRQEMNCYCAYLLGKSADESSLQLFDRAIRREETTLSSKEIKLLEFMISNQWSVSFVDSALGMFHPHHRLRKRMIIAFAILETQPAYYDFFRPRVFGSMHFLKLIFQGAKEVMAAVAGRILLLFF